MALAAGKLRHRVSLQRQQLTQNAATGEMTTTWVVVAEAWASIEPLSARELLAAQAMQSQVTARIVMRKREIDASWRIVSGTKRYNIHGILTDPVSGAEYITLPCSEGLTDGR